MNTTFPPTTVNVYDKLKSLNIVLPPLAVPAAAYVPYVQTGDLVFLSGHIARREGKVWAGQLGDAISTAEGQQAARAVAIDLLGTLQAACGGDLNRVRRIVKVMSLVNSTPTFTEQHLVTNGCSELLGEIFAERGTHARSAFGVAQIPLGACVEIELIAELYPAPVSGPSHTPATSAVTSSTAPLGTGAGADATPTAAPATATVTVTAPAPGPEGSLTAALATAAVAAVAQAPVAQPAAHPPVQDTLPGEPPASEPALEPTQTEGWPQQPQDDTLQDAATVDEAIPAEVHAISQTVPQPEELAADIAAKASGEAATTEAVLDTVPDVQPPLDPESAHAPQAQAGAQPPADTGADTAFAPAPTAMPQTVLPEHAQPDMQPEVQPGAWADGAFDMQAAMPPGDMLDGMPGDMPGDKQPDVAAVPEAAVPDALPGGSLTEEPLSVLLSDVDLAPGVAAWPEEVLPQADALAASTSDAPPAAVLGTDTGAASDHIPDTDPAAPAA